MPKNTDNPRIGLDLKKLAELREKRGLTMDQAARAAGMTNRQQWYAIESGRKQDVRLSTLDAICKALQCKPSDLLQ